MFVSEKHKLEDRHYLAIYVGSPKIGLSLSIMSLCLAIHTATLRYEVVICRWWPLGLQVIRNFVTSDEAIQLVGIYTETWESSWFIFTMYKAVLHPVKTYIDDLKILPQYSYVDFQYIKSHGFNMIKSGKSLPLKLVDFVVNTSNLLWLTHLPVVMHICLKQHGEHWFR